MEEFINTYLPQIITAITGFVSAGGCMGLLGYLNHRFKKFTEEIKNSTEVAQIKAQCTKIIDTNKACVAENLALKKELEELLKAIYTGKVTEYKEKVDEVINHYKEV